MSSIAELCQNAREVIGGCIGVKGVWASDSEGRYAHMCRTRDLGLGIADAILGDPVLARRYEGVVRRHVCEIARAQDSVTGRIPMLIPDALEDVIAAKRKAGDASFLMRRYEEEKPKHPGDPAYGIHFLTPVTTDSEIMFLLAAKPFEKELREPIRLALEYVSARLSPTGLHLGADYRDIRTKEGHPTDETPPYPYLDDKPVLSMQCMLYRVYELYGRYEEAEKLKRRINDIYWNPADLCYWDYPSVPPQKYFDVLGNALAVYCEVADEERAAGVINMAMREALASRFLIHTRDALIPPMNDDANEEAILTFDRAEIYPWVNGMMILAMVKAKAVLQARVLFKKWWFGMPAVAGFYEWYDVSKGQGHGGRNQGLTAALFLMAAEALNCAH